MQFEINKSSEWEYKDFVEISSLEDLLKFCRENGELIISIDNENNVKLEIYDDHRE